MLQQCSNDYLSCPLRQRFVAEGSQNRAVYVCSILNTTMETSRSCTKLHMCTGLCSYIDSMSMTSSVALSFFVKYIWRDRVPSGQPDQGCQALDPVVGHTIDEFLGRYQPRTTWSSVGSSMGVHKVLFLLFFLFFGVFCSELYSN